MSINDQISSELTSHTIDLMRVDTNTRAKIRGILKQLEDDIVKKINRIDPTGPGAQTFRMSRLEKLLKAVKESIRASYKKNKVILTDDLIEIARLETQEAINTINQMVRVELATVTLTPAVTRELAKNTLIQGAPSADWWSRQASALQTRFADEMRMGMLAGENNGDLVRRVRGTATGKKEFMIINGKRRFIHEFAGGIMDVTTSQAEALVRSSVQSVANNARNETYQQNRDVIKGVSVVATLDLRTSDICKARSPMAWTLEGDPLNSSTTERFPGPPGWHWNCRSTLSPVLKSWDELSNRKKGSIKEINPTTQSSMDGQVAETLTYEEWLSKQSKARQIKALGKRRWELWKEGKIKNFTELIDQSGRPITIDKLSR